MLLIRKINPMVRAIGTMGAVAATVGAVTFATFTTNTVALQNNNLGVTQDVLRIWNGSSWQTTAPGFTDNSLIVGTEGPLNEFCLQNLANTNLFISARIPSGWSPTGIDVSKVHIKFYDKDKTNVLLNTTFAALTSGDQTLGNRLDAQAQGSCVDNSQEGNYYYSVTVDPDAITGSTGNVSGFDLIFTGTSTT
jgi:hypothetical protein